MTRQDIDALLRKTSALVEIDYTHSWWAGLSELPGKGRDSFKIERHAERFEGAVALEFSPHCDGELRIGPITCGGTVRLRASEIDSLFRTGIGFVRAGSFQEVATVDGGWRDVVHLQFGEARLKLIRSGTRGSLWGCETRAALNDERIPVESPNLHVLIACLEARWGMREQAERIYMALAAWSQHMR